MAFTIEKEELRNGYKLVVIFTSMGHRCGYVGVPKSHILYGHDYSAIIPLALKEKQEEVLAGTIGKRGPMAILASACTKEQKIDLLFDVHGSLTYSGGRDYPVQNQSGTWWFFGFDCGHYGDRADEEAAEQYGYENSMHTMIFNDGEVRTLDYTWTECESLYRQLKELEHYGQAG